VHLGERCRQHVAAHRYAVIADSRVAELYGNSALEALAGSGLEAELFPFPAGEWNKSRAEWSRLSDALLAAGFGRDAAVVGLGGGVTGDLAGFVAATFMRGIPVVQVPTTLLAMLDSSVGGKTGVDAPGAKNAFGAFHHPAHVLIDPSLLVTLPLHQRAAGLAEAVKAAAIADAALFAWMEEFAPSLLQGSPEKVGELIERTVRIKAEVVEADPTESGRRAVLNFGHTVGHALEALSEFDLLHGEAVAAGMRVEARLGEAVGVTAPGTAARIGALLDLCGLRDRPERDATPEEVLQAAASDKKARGGALRWVLLAEVGAVASADEDLVESAEADVDTDAEAETCAHVGSDGMAQVTRRIGAATLRHELAAALRAEPDAAD